MSDEREQKEQDTFGLHRQRMEALGVLAGGIAHDVNNILTGILGHVSYLMAILPKSGPHIASLQAIEDGAKKSAGMTRQILDFSKVESSEKLTEIDLSRLVTSACNLLRGAISKQFKLLFEIPAQPIVVHAAEAQLTQVLINLVVNARDALQPGGEIRISLREVELLGGEGELTPHTTCPALRGRFACLSVADNGHGIPPEIIGKIFEPYFSTKKDKGTGLGLATVNAIVGRHRGAVDISSRIGVGTKMMVYLPVSTEGPPVKILLDEQPPALIGGNERLLIVDDEYPVRSVLGLSLERLGYKVTLAASGTEALEIFTPGSFDLVILDMIMPDLSGREVFYELMRRDRKARVLISTAYSSDEIVKAILRDGGKGYIQKPFAIEELARRVRECIDQ